jgi:hypothetical protein
MLAELNDRLTELGAKKLELERLEGLIAAAEKELAGAREQLAELAAALRQAEAGVAHLEGRSLKGLYHSLIGEREMQLKKERERYLSAKLKHEGCQHTAGALEAELAELKGRQDALGDLDAQYASVLEEKERLLAGSDSAVAGQMIRLSEGLAEVQAESKEIGEAISAGRELLAGLAGVIHSLKNAKGWGTFDLLGGGLVATAVKHAKVKEAREQMHRVQALLGRFQRELADVIPFGPIAGDISSFDLAADYFLDGLVFDWIVQSKIKQALEGVQGLEARARTILADLHEELTEVQERGDYLAAERRAIIEGA